MSSRERKRADRRKRKQRAAGTASGAVPAPEPAAVNGDGSASVEEPQAGTVEDLAAEAEARGPSRSELRNQQAREELEPLEVGERPLVVTLGAVVSMAIALITVGAWLAGAEVDIANTDLRERPNPVQVFAPAILFATMAIGMWRTRYWAVLGFQAIMAIFMVGAIIVLVASTSIVQALSVTAVLIVAAGFFWFTVKALARIQMPERNDSLRR